MNLFLSVLANTWLSGLGAARVTHPLVADLQAPDRPHLPRTDRSHPAISGPQELRSPYSLPAY